MNLALKDGEDSWLESPKMLTRLMTVMFMLSKLKVSSPCLCDSPVEPGNTHRRPSSSPDTELRS